MRGGRAIIIGCQVKSMLYFPAASTRDGKQDGLTCNVAGNMREGGGRQGTIRYGTDEALRTCDAAVRRRGT